MMLEIARKLKSPLFFDAPRKSAFSCSKVPAPKEKS
jgi:hypothetical protein